MKKIFALTICSALLLSLLLTGCDGEKKDNNTLGGSNNIDASDLFDPLGFEAEADSETASVSDTTEASGTTDVSETTEVSETSAAE